MDKTSHSAALISDFNLENFAAVLRHDTDLPELSVTVAAFGQVSQVLLNKDADIWNRKHDVIVVWTRPQAVIESFARLLDGVPVATDSVISDVDQFADNVLALQSRARYVLVMSWSLAEYDTQSGLLDFDHRLGASFHLMQMNLRLSERLGHAPNFFLLNAEPWLRSAGKAAYNPKLCYMAKVPFAPAVWSEAAKAIKSACRGVLGLTRKIIVLDLDNTLWGGIVGDIGWEKLNLGGHDAVGEAYRDFQRGLSLLKNRGVLLAIVSKNEESVALEAISRHPEMVLRLEDFCGWRINWQDKAANVAELMAELNLGLQSAVFIDDNPVERARVKDALPEVLVPDWPEDKMYYRSALMGLRCFDQPAVSDEDLVRTSMYRQEKERVAARAAVGSYEQWLATLGTRVVIEDLNEANLGRAAQLLNKTNQMNLKTRRVTESELVDWARLSGRGFKTFRVSDRFGDAGLTGILSWQEVSGDLDIVDFVLSCRVMGRGIEETMLAVAIEHARRKHLAKVSMRYIPTAKNAPCHKFLLSSGLAQVQDHQFEWDCSQGYESKTYISLSNPQERAV